MRMDSLDDPWMLPTRQDELLGRPVLAPERLHRRRESTFLVLAMLFLVATAAMPLLGASRVIDVGHALSVLVPDLTLAFAPGLPVGVLAFPVAFLAINLVCELYGRRRANALLLVGLLASFAMAGLMYVTDVLDGDTAGFGMALALTACFFVAHVANLVIFDALRHRMAGRHGWLRKTASTILSQIGGWAAFAFVLYGYDVRVAGLDAALVTDTVVSLAIGSALYVVAFALADVIPFAIARKSLSLYLRVDPTRDDEDELVVAPGRADADRSWDRPVETPLPRAVPLAPAMIVETPVPRAVTRAPALIVETPLPGTLPRVEVSEVVVVEAPHLLTPPVAETPVVVDAPVVVETPVVAAPAAIAEPPRRITAPMGAMGRTRRPRNSLQPFSSAEMRFFTEGEELSEVGEEPVPSRVSAG